MNKHKAIMEVMSASKQIEALETAAKALEGWKELEQMAKPLRNKQEELERYVDMCADAAAGGELDINEALNKRE